LRLPGLQHAFFARAERHVGSFDEAYVNFRPDNDENFCYGAFETNVSADVRTKGFRMAVRTRNRPSTGFVFDSSRPDAVPDVYFVRVSNPGFTSQAPSAHAEGTMKIQNNDTAAWDVYHAVVEAEEAFFAENGHYTASYDELAKNGLLTIDPDLCYGAILLKTSQTGTYDPGYSFFIRHRSDRAPTYEYDSLGGDNLVVLSERKFPCVR